MTERWRLVRHFGGGPGFHMAADETLLVSGGREPVLRLYTWEPAALSLGYFQRYADVAATAEAEAVVRRITGGGAIHHAHELTFAIAAPDEHPLYRGEVRASYERVHAVIVAALFEVGVEARLRAEAALASDRQETGMCFHESTDLDIAWDGRKGVGSAQRRTAGRVLHHGSIKVGGDALEPGVATVQEGRPGTSPEDLAGVLEECFARLLEVELVPGELTEAERKRAESRAAHFTSREFLHRR